LSLNRQNDKGFNEAKIAKPAIVVSKSTTADDAMRLGICPNRCGHCCINGSGYVLESEKAKVAKHLGLTTKDFERDFLEPTQYKKAKRFRQVRKEGKPHGHCIFLTDKGCSIQDVKSLHCRIATCTVAGEDLANWYLVNYLIDWNDDDDVMKYMQYEKSRTPIKGGRTSELISRIRLSRLGG
jgi:Fe-S-cluster containining protein